jgi:hypothetical protein
VVAREIEFPERDEVFLVSQRKYNLDPSRPWWEKVFFNRVWLPLNRFAFKRMGIGGPAGADRNGDVFLIEEQGVYTDEELAKQSCEGPYWSVKPLPVDSPLPAESFQYKGHKYPQSVMPDRFRRRVDRLGAVQVSQLVEVTRRLRKINEKAADA